MQPTSMFAPQCVLGVTSVTIHISFMGVTHILKKLFELHLQHTEA
jgi:hypothetical protein